jgi:hypothetical protein
MTAATLLRTGPGQLVSVNICGGADAATVTVYDAVSATGTVLCKLGVAAGTSDSFCPCLPLAAGIGIYVGLTGTTPQISVAYI